VCEDVCRTAVWHTSSHRKHIAVIGGGGGGGGGGSSSSSSSSSGSSSSSIILGCNRKHVYTPNFMLPHHHIDFYIFNKF